MDIVGGGESFPLTPRAKKYIQTLVDCFSRYALAIPILDQSSETVINAVIGNYITEYGTPRRILIDQGKCFESALFHSFCNIFCIHKIHTPGIDLSATASANVLSNRSSTPYVSY